MSGAGAPRADAEALAGAASLRVGLVVARWHGELTSAMAASARRALAEAGVAHVTELEVPGAFELPLGAAVLVDRGAAAVVALGVVVRGGTPHFDYVCAAATDGLSRLALDTRVPVGFGLLTCDTEEQARDRAGLATSSEDKGFEAAQAAVWTALAITRLGA